MNMNLDEYLKDWFSRRLTAARERDPNPESEYGLEYVAFRAEVAFNDLLKEIQRIEIQSQDHERKQDHQDHGA